MLAIAKYEGRVVITRDRKLLEFRDARGRVVVLNANTVSECVEELSQKLELDWLHRPFTRCLLCNGLLVQANGRAWEQVPKHSRACIAELFACEACGKVYWEGAHVRRMRTRLREWQEYPD